MDSSEELTTTLPARTQTRPRKKQIEHLDILGMPIIPGNIVVTNYYGRQLVIARVISTSPKMIRLQRIDNNSRWTFQRYPEEIAVMDSSAATIAVLRASSNG